MMSIIETEFMFAISERSPSKKNSFFIIDFFSFLHCNVQTSKHKKNLADYKSCMNNSVKLMSVFVLLSHGFCF